MSFIRVQRLTEEKIPETTTHPTSLYADVLRGSSRVPAPLSGTRDERILAPLSGTRDEPLRTSAWEANMPHAQSLNS